jgi:hypothetical protein
MHVCDRCALRVADLAIDPRSRIWAADPVRELRPRKPTVTAPPVEPEPDFEKFKDSIEREIAIDDADSHLALAQAYGEMGLYVDATREAGVAIRAQPKASTTSDALRLLLGEPLLGSSGLKRLRERLRRPLH